VQVYIPTLEYEGDEVEETYGIIKENLEKNGKGTTNTIIRGDWNSVVGDKSYQNIGGPHGHGRRNQKGEMLIDFCKETDSLSPTHGLRRLREDCTKHQEIETNVCWITYS
jgi:hypothetical protein